jgi:mannosyl-3-phosphoglycerate phosphatase
MKIRAVLTDLDGTLLEPDTTVHRDVPEVLSRLGALGIPVCPVTSKTPAELELVFRDLSLTGPAGFENGAGIWHADGLLSLVAAAVPMAELRQVLVALRGRTTVPFRSFKDLSDRKLAAITGLLQEGVKAARQRIATMPLLVDPIHDETLRAALPVDPPVRLIRGNRFLHLQGWHDKADAVSLLLEALGPGDGVTVACGDAPNDSGLLAAADVQVIVPSARGPHPALIERFPNAPVAPLPNGRGWAAAIASLLGMAE